MDGVTVEQVTTQFIITQRISSIFFILQSDINEFRPGENLKYAS